MSATPQDVLRVAARILMRDGWWDGSIGQGGAHTRKCAAVAIGRAANGSGVGQEAALNHFAIYLGVSGVTNTDNFDGIVDWNDAPERTAEDVILALKCAAEES